MHARGRAVLRRRAGPDQEGLPRRRSRRTSRPLPGRRARDRRPHEHPRARHHADDRAARVRPDPQPVGPRRARRADRAAARPPRSAVGHGARSRTRATAAARSGSPRACCGLVGLKTSRGRTSVGPGERRARPAALGAVRGDPLGARRRRAARRGRRARGRRPGRRRRRRASRYASQVEHRAGAAAHRADDDDAGHRGSGRPRVRRRRRADRAACSTRPATTSSVAHPAAFDETERMTAFIPIWSAMAAVEHDRDRPPHRPRRRPRTTSSRSPGSSPSTAARSTGGRAPRRAERDGRVHPPVHAVVGRRLGPAAHPDARRAAAGARRAPDARRPVRRLRPRRHLHAVHAGREPDRPARDLAARRARARAGCRSASHFIAALGREDLLLQVAAQLVERSRRLVRTARARRHG